MLDNFKTHIETNFSFLANKKVLLAISGGIDSVVLFHLFKAIPNINIYLAHCNFKLRGRESDLDEEFVNNLTQISSNQIFTKSFETENYSKKNKLSTQIAARKLRYEWFNELVSEHNLDYIATAHHADDNLETFLINFTRGTGLKGLTGIPEINGNIIRPLLPFSRKEIEDFAKENNISWREDASNASDKYTRNKLRHHVLPILKVINPNIFESFSNTINHIKEANTIIEDSISDFSKKAIIKEGDSLKIDIQVLKETSNSKAYLYQILNEYNFTEWNDVNELISAQSGKFIVSKTHRLVKDRDFLILTEFKSNIESEVIFIQKNETSISEPISLKLSKSDSTIKENKHTILVDEDCLQFPLILRKWKNGDVIYPSGMKGKKKVSKYFKDEKFSLVDKENTWLLCNGNDAIIWIVNHRKDSRFQVSEKTKKILKLTTAH